MLMYAGLTVEHGVNHLWSHWVWSYIFYLSWCLFFCRRLTCISVSIQLLSLSLTGIGVFVTLFASHTRRDVSTTFSAGIYFILSATAGPCVAYQPGFVDKLKRHWWKFMIIGLADFYSTYLQTLAFNYTSVSST